MSVSERKIWTSRSPITSRQLSCSESVRHISSRRRLTAVAPLSWFPDDPFATKRESVSVPKVLVDPVTCSSPVECGSGVALDL